MKFLLAGGIVKVDYDTNKVLTFFVILIAKSQFRLITYELGMEKELCFIDIETTGTIFGFHEIIDIAVIRTSSDGKKIIDQKTCKIKPIFPERITLVAQKLTNYDPDEWINASQSNSVVWNDFKKFWERSIPVCHNPSFERAFISLEMFKYGIDDTNLGYHWIGTESLFWPWVLKERVNKISLSEILNYFKLPEEPKPHIAINGAQSCRLAYLKLTEAFDSMF